MKKLLCRSRSWVARAGVAALLGSMPCAALAGDLQAFVRDQSGRGVPDAVVVAVPAKPLDGATAGTSATIIVDQVNKEFVPYVLPIQVGTAVSFPNRDDIRHHVYSFSPAKHFELPLYTGTPAAPILFDKPGVVVLGCNIHDWMIAYLYVAESPYFARTGSDGKAKIVNLPAGEYAVRAWHPRLQGKGAATERKLMIPATGAIDVTWDVGLMPDFRIRRAPIPGQGGY